MDMLNRIIDYKKQEVEVRKLMVPEDDLMESVWFHRKTFSLKQFLLDETKTGIIAEFKKKSPSKGFINANADVKTVTKAYTEHGASGLSVLTDNHFFGGSSEDLLLARENDIPILRKDFIIDPYQLIVSKAIGADVILLIASCLSKAKVKELSGHAKKLGLEVILELHDAKEIGHICDGIEMVGINNRNLKSFAVDIDHSLTLANLLPKGMITIAESGINDIATINAFKNAGYKGFLIGEKFMKEPDPGEAFREFAQQLKN